MADAEVAAGTRARVLVALAAVAVLVVAVIAVDLAAVRNSAAAARHELDAGLTSLGAGDLAEAAGHLESVRGHVTAAAAGTDRPAWRLVARLPLVSDDLATAEAAIDAAAAATSVAGVIVDQIAVVTNPDGTTRLRDADGRLDFGPTEQASAGLAAMDTSELAAALERLAATPDAGLLTPVATGRTETLAEAGRLLAVAESARSMAAVLPSFLGADGPREYFLAMQNLGEVRGTGGLIGFFATVRIDRGRLQLTEPERYEVLDADPSDGVETVVGADTLPDGFMDRYGKHGPTTFLANANLDPDFATASTILLNLYERDRGRRLDGVIALDPIGLAFAHAAIGPVHLPEGTPSGSLPTSIPPARLAPILMIDAYDALGGDSPERKAYLAQVAESAFRGITSGQWSALAMVKNLAHTAGAGHLQVFSTHADEQAVFEDLDVAGRLTAPDGHDQLAIIANNSAGNKADVHVGHTIAGRIALEAGDGRDHLDRQADLTVTVQNPLPTTGRDQYIIGSSLPGQGFIEAFTGPPGLTRTWFSIWAPVSTTAMTLINANGTFRPDPEIDQVHGLKVVDYVLEVQSQTSRAFQSSVTGPVPVTTLPDGSLVYELVLHRQAKGIPDRLDLAITPPPGWAVTSAALTGGGGNDPAFGPHGEPGPAPTATIADGMVRVQGDMTRTATVTITLQASDDG